MNTLGLQDGDICLYVVIMLCSCLSRGCPVTDIAPHICSLLLFFWFFWPSVDTFPREFKNWDIQNWIQICQSVQSGVGKLSCNKTALKRCTSTETLWNRKAPSLSSPLLLWRMTNRRLLISSTQFVCVCLGLYYCVFKYLHVLFVHDTSGALRELS